MLSAFPMEQQNKTVIPAARSVLVIFIVVMCLGANWKGNHANRGLMWVHGVKEIATNPRHMRRPRVLPQSKFVIFPEALPKPWKLRTKLSWRGKWGISFIKHCARSPVHTLKCG